MSNDTQVQAHMALVAIAIQVVRDNALDRGASLDDVRRTTADVEASARQLSEQGAPVVKRIDLTADQLAGLTCKTDVQIGGAMPERDDFMQGIFVALQHVKADNSVIWREIVESVGVDDALNYAAFVEPAEWELAGFDQFAKQELGRTKPRKRRARPLTASPTAPSTEQRPQNCGTGFCSCIECPYVPSTEASEPVGDGYVPCPTCGANTASDNPNQWCPCAPREYKGRP